MSTTTLAFDIIAKDRASDKFDNVGDSASRSSGKLKKFAAVGAVAAAAGAVMVGRALVGMTQAAMEDEQSQKMLKVALENSTGATTKQVGATEKWITAQGKALGIADDELRPALAKLARATGDIGKAQDLTSLAMDVSAGSGKSLTTVTEALMKAQNGSLGGLSRLGVATTNADGSTKSLAQVTKELAELHGGQAQSAANTTEGKMKRLKLMYEETKESIGAKLIPVVSSLATWFLDKLVPAAQKVGQWLSEKLGPPLRELGEKAGPLAKQVVDALSNAFSDAQPFIQGAGMIIKNVVLPVLGKLFEAVGPQLVGAIKGIGVVLGGIGAAGQAMWNNVLAPVFRFFLGAIGTAMTKLGDLFVAMGKVPGFGWATTLGEKLQGAGAHAKTLGDNIRNIPDRKDVAIHVTTFEQAVSLVDKGKGGAGKAEATGTNYASGGRTLVGERGPEFVDLPAGAKVHTATQSRGMGGDPIDYRRLARAIAEAVAEGAPLVRLVDAGRSAYLQTGQ